MTTDDNTEGASAAAQALANQCVAAIENALKRFGEYSYYDKGAREVLNVERLADEARKLAPSEVGQALLLLLDHEHGEPLAEDILHCLDSTYDSKEWDEMMGVDRRIADLY